MSNTKKLTRAEATAEMERYKDFAEIAKDVILNMVNYHNVRVAPIQFAQTKKFVAKCEEAGVKLAVFIGVDPIIKTISTSVLAVDSETAQGILDEGKEDYGLIDFIMEDKVQSWMKKVVDLGEFGDELEFDTEKEK